MGWPGLLLGRLHPPALAFAVARAAGAPLGDVPVGRLLPPPPSAATMPPRSASASRNAPDSSTLGRLQGERSAEPSWLEA